MAKNNKKLEVEKLKAEVEQLKKELKKKKKYGLVWEEKPEEVVEMYKEKLPVLKEVKNKEIITDENKPVNLLIEGDNYHALSVLNYTHAKKIDVIYIDPPYNTGNKDFIFNDHYVDKEDAYRHSKWLSFMEKRLKLAKNLLKDTGVIFISIDDNEISQLRLLMGEIFGENNFVNTLLVKRATKNLNIQFGRVPSLNQAFEYILVYRRNKEFYYKNPFKNTSDKRKEGYWTSFYNNADRPTMRYEIEGISIDKGQWKWEKIRGLRALKNYKKYLKHYANKISLKEYWENNKEKYKQKTGFELEFLRKYKSSIQYWVRPAEKTLMDTNLMDFYINDNLGKSLYGFDTVKNLKTMEKVISIVSDKHSIILDFMAGSGTTGHAVLDLNKEDGGNRQFILCTNNENNICTDVCYPRIKKVIEGYKNLKGEKVEGLGGNLKYFKTDFVDYHKPTDKNKINLTKQATEMLCIKEGTFEKVVDNERFKIFKNSNHYTGIIWDQTAIPAFKKAIKDIKGKFSVYVFSLGDETFNEEFEDIKQKVKLSPIPEAILRVYRRIFK